MAKLIDYQCRYAEYSGISEEAARAKGLSLPEAYFSGEQIAALAGENPVLPFDPVLEAEAMGAKIKFDASPLGPRKEEDIVTKIDQLAELPVMDITKGRLSETLKAVRLINQSGSSASIELHGPVTIVNGVSDLMKILMGWRKKPEIMDAFFAKVSEGLVNLALAARDAGCRVIYYTDSPGSLNILGPKYARQITENFTVPFLTELDARLPEDCVIHLCPKTSFLLAGCEKAQWKKLQLPQPMLYKDACLFACGKVRILGQRCRKAENITVTCINYLEITEARSK